MKILNFGSLNYDYVYGVDHMVRAGETQHSKSRQTFLGGKGFNQSVALSKAGVQVFHAGALGDDGEEFLQACHEYGIDTTYITKVAGPSGHTVIQIDKNAQNCILLYGGSNQSINREFVDEVLQNFNEGDMILLQNEIGELAYIIEQASKRKMQIIFNPSPYNEDIEKCDMNKIGVFMLNEIEGEMMSGESGPIKILQYMKEQYPHAKVILTLGEEGAIYQDIDQNITQKAFSTEAVDTTAAGDTFTGYFIAGLLAEKPIREVLMMAAKASAITVSRKGAAESIPMMKEVI